MAKYLIWNGGQPKKVGNRKPELMEIRDATGAKEAGKYAKAKYTYGWFEHLDTVSALRLKAALQEKVVVVPSKFKELKTYVSKL